MLDILVDSSEDKSSSLIPDDAQNDLKLCDDIIIETSSSSSQGGEGGAKLFSTSFKEIAMSSSGIVIPVVLDEDVTKRQHCVDIGSEVTGVEELKSVR